MQEIQNEIYFLQKDAIKYNEQMFLTITFDKLGKTVNYFLANVKRQRRKWVKSPPLSTSVPSLTT